MRKKFFSSLFVVFVGCALPCLGQTFLEGGMSKEEHDALYKDGYALYLSKLLPLAENGNAKAQHIVGGLYSPNRDYKGVQKDIAKKVMWLTRAANQGHPGAQYDLGMVYLGFQGVKKDGAAAYKWMSLAAAQGDKLATGYLKQNGNAFTQFEKTMAQRKVKEFVAKVEGQ